MLNCEACRDLRSYLAHPHPSVRVCACLALGTPGRDRQVLRDRALLLEQPPVSEILAAQYPQGYWMHRDLGISPRYRATVWQLLVLAQLGVGPVVVPGSSGGARLPEAVRRAIAVVREDNVTKDGALRLRQDTASPALTAAVLWAVARMGAGHLDDWSSTWTWVKEQVTGAAIGSAAAVWITRAAVAWGRQTWLAAQKPWRAVVWPQPPGTRLTLPVALQPDLLAAMEMACDLDHSDLIPDETLMWLQARRRPDGTWPLDRIPGRLWCDIGELGSPNPWLTVRALSVLTRLS